MLHGILYTSYTPRLSPEGEFRFLSGVKLQGLRSRNGGSGARYSNALFGKKTHDSFFLPDILQNTLLYSTEKRKSYRMTEFSFLGLL